METLSSVIIAIFCFHLVNADTILCGRHECKGDNPYCCQLDDGSTGCCWANNVLDVWWLWFLLVFFIFLLFSSCACCYQRRRRARFRYHMMTNSEYPSYGTVVHAAPRHMVYNTPAHQGYPSAPEAPPIAYMTNPVAATPVAPPSYETAQATKPPPYSG